MRELTKLGLEYESPTNELNAGSSKPRYEWLTLPISRGRLGLTLSFGKGYFGNNNSGIMITAIDEKSALKEHVNVGDWLMMIDNKGVQRVEDLETGKDKEIRMFKIAKQMPLHGTYLSAERVERLNAIGLTWNRARPPAKTWDERLDILKQYKETHGTWPNRHEKWNGVGEWIHNQRRYYKQKDKKFMADRAPKLDEIGFPWVMQSYTNLSWEDSFQKLVEFGRVNRHFDVPPPEGSGAGVEEATRFYRWIGRLHTAYKAYQNGNKTFLNEERVNKLLQIGFEFTSGPVMKRAKRAAVPEIAFETRLEQLQSFYSEFGHYNIDFRFDQNQNIGGWCAQISRQYKDWQDGKTAIHPTTENQFNQLSAIGFQFNVIAPAKQHRRSWEENFNAFLEFKQLHGHTNVPRSYKIDIRLGTWVALQRKEHKLHPGGNVSESKSRQDRYEKLERNGFLWDVEDS